MPTFRQPSTLPIQVLAMLVGVTFLSAAVVKIATGWLDPATSATQGWVVAHAAQTGADPAQGAAVLSTIPRNVWLLMDPLAVAFEAGMFIAAMRRHWLVRYLLIAAGFHLGAHLTVGPAFVEIAVVFLAFPDSIAWPAALRDHSTAWSHGCASIAWVQLWRLVRVVLRTSA